LTREFQIIAAHSLVLATGSRTDMQLATDLFNLGGAPTLIGDIDAPRNAAAAIFEGRNIALLL